MEITAVDESGLVQLYSSMENSIVKGVIQGSIWGKLNSLIFVMIETVTEDSACASGGEMRCTLLRASDSWDWYWTGTLTFTATLNRLYPKGFATEFLTAQF